MQHELYMDSWYILGGITDQERVNGDCYTRAKQRLTF
jgi:hypothetical protein